MNKHVPVSQDKLSDLRLVLDESIDNVVELQDCSGSELSDDRETLQLLGATTSCLTLFEVLFSYSFLMGYFTQKRKLLTVMSF